MTVSASRWDLTNVYPSLESKEFKNAIKKYKKLLDELEALNYRMSSPEWYVHMNNALEQKSR